jgi:hypothetical protein
LLVAHQCRKKKQLSARFFVWWFCAAVYYLFDEQMESASMRTRFNDRELTKAHAAWWELWHDHKDDLKAAGFKLDKDEDGRRWLLSFAPVDGVHRDDPALLALRQAAQRSYDEAEAAHALTRTAMIRAFRELRKLYTKAEWLEPLIDEAMRALDMVGDDEAAEVDRDVRLMSSVTNAQDIIDADNEDEALPAEVVNLEQARTRLRDNTAPAPTLYLIRKRGTPQAAHIWDGSDTLCRMWSTGGLKQENFEVHDSPQGRNVCAMCRNAAFVPAIAVNGNTSRRVHSRPAKTRASGLARPTLRPSKNAPGAVSRANNAELKTAPPRIGKCSGQHASVPLGSSKQSGETDEESLADTNDRRRRDAGCGFRRQQPKIIHLHSVRKGHRS